MEYLRIKIQSSEENKSIIMEKENEDEREFK